MKLTFGFTGKKTTLKNLVLSVGPGWKHLVEDLVKDLLALGWDGVVFQVKEKFAGLRFYIGGASREVHDRIDQAERMSFFICEDCGKFGLPRGPGWHKTLCEAHAKARKGSSAEIVPLNLYIYEGDPHKIVATISIRLGKAEDPPEEGP